MDYNPFKIHVLITVQLKLHSIFINKKINQEAKKIKYNYEDASLLTLLIHFRKLCFIKSLLKMHNSKYKMCDILKLMYEFGL